MQRIGINGHRPDALVPASSRGAGRWVFGVALAAALLIGGRASAQHVDVQVQVVANTIVTGRINFSVPPPFPIEPNVRVFSAVFGDSGVGSFTSNPGFNAPTGTMPTGTIVGFNILDALRKWNGADFSTIPAERLSINLSTTTRMTPAMADQFVAGFSFVAADSQGSFHQHLNYFLNPPQSLGVYALKLELTAPGSGIAGSAPFWVVFRQGNTAQLMQQQSDAVNYLNALLEPPACPGDADGDHAVGITDIAVLIQHWGQSVTPGTNGDLNEDGVVGIGDVAIVIQNWGEACS
ncbi:MAG TPA: dockerin type I domain-containing protein [Phycisphaerales bacterium]|nr:dockerin type I domain-containing protein [Phycisphaerales bacterium]